ncbi:MAG: gamma-glutamyltranspeptidase / glutathione hydrolase, partial [Thermomicrobiales bacterium]|nr:gamma-glutamyltranspeptidase / glutathione hydrolase [Thermomicrobiales bacterium]
IERTEATARGGMVAAKTPEAAQAGADVLARGGNAVDAAVACALVAGVVEPWMNGIGGGGYLVRHDPRSDEATVVEFPMVAPAGAQEEMFPLSGAGTDAALFGWPAVVDNANIVGHRAAAVPGTVAGLALALERYGSISFAQALAPAIDHAEAGVPVTWHTTLEIARDLANLARFPATRAVFCDANGFAPFTIDGSRPVMLRQADLARTLRRLADEGPRSFYEGELGEAMARHLAENGASFTAADFANYQPVISQAVRAPFDGHELVTVGGATGGTTLAESMRLLDGLGVGRLDHNAPEALHLTAQAFRIAFADRYAYLADPRHVEVPLKALLSDDYVGERRKEIQEGPTRGTSAGSRERLGVRHSLATSMADYAKGGSTTHLSVIDKDGVAVSLTQTLLSVWGSRVVVPGTGVLLNNGMMWFDPEPGRPNSVGGGKRPLSNMSPAILTRDGRALAALGASGGRRILNCVAQLAINLIHHGMTMQPAVSAPRIDASTPDLLVDARLAASTREALASLGHRVVVKDERQFRGDFASPACVQFADGVFRGGVDPFYFPATAVGH